jgi:hypothetical protein
VVFASELGTAAALAIGDRLGALVVTRLVDEEPVAGEEPALDVAGVLEPPPGGEGMGREGPFTVIGSVTLAVLPPVSVTVRVTS